MTSPRRTLFRCLGVAVAVALTMMVKEITDAVFGPGPPLVLFLAAVMVVARYGGLGPALAATVLSALVCLYFYLPPYGSMRIANANDGFRLAIFLLEATTLSALMESLRASRRRAEQDAVKAVAQEEALRHSERQLADFFENGAIGLHSIGPDGTILRANRAELRLLGYEHDEYVGRNIGEFHVDPAAMADMLRRLRAGEELRDYEAPLRCKDGSIRDILITSNVEWDAQGQFLHARCFSRDITERKEAERALRESEERSRMLTEGVIDYAILMLDPDGRVVNWNAGAERIKGYRADEILGEHFSRFFLPEDVMEGKPERELRAAAAEGRVEATGWRVRKDGTAFWANVVITAIREGDGGIRGFSKFTRDITARKLAEDALSVAKEELEARTAQLGRVNDRLQSELDERRRVEDVLKESEKRFRSLSASSPIGIFQTDAEGLGIYANERCLAILEMGLDETLGNGWTRSIHPDDVDGVFSAWMSAAEAGCDFSREYRLLSQSGELRWVHARAVSIPTDDGMLSGHVGTLEDITSRKRAEESLRMSEIRFQMMARATNDAIWDWDLAMNGLWMNEGVQSLFGYPADEVVADFAWRSDRIHPDDWASIEPGFRAVLDNGGSFWSGEYRFRHRDGSYSNVLDRGHVIRDDAGRPVRMVGSMMDVSGRKREEAKLLRAREDAESATRAKSEFLANMSHEIRTPMNGIIGMTELTLETPLSPRQREYLGLVMTSAESLLTVINDILDFSKIEAGKMELDPAPFDIRDSVVETLRTLAIRAHEKGLELACRFGFDVPETLVGDAGRLRQVMINLVGNAIKFTERGEIVVDVAIDGEAGDGGVLRFSVADTGIGIPAEKRGTIFAAFEQADGSTTRKYGGTGLGLTISVRLVELMGGRIWVEENPGGGSRFLFTSRFAPDTEARPCRLAFEPSTVAGLRVLIVDDNRTNRLILEEFLTHWGAAPVAVDGGEAALAALKAAAARGEPFSVLLLDQMMPGMDGFELARQVRETPGIASVGMLMLTSGDPWQARRHGIAECLIKPVRQSDLLDALSNLLNGEGRRLTRRAEKIPIAVAGGEADGRRLLVLLAEDNVVNQKVAARMLENLGHEVVIVGDGRAAVETVEAGVFDIVLMDVQMPEMDGFEAVAIIRAREESTGAHVPIIALTAHSMAGDRERCLAAGCDGYLSKPVQSAALREALARLVRPLDSPPAVGRDEGEACPAFDRTRALACVGGDEELLAEVLEMFFDDWPRLSSEMRTAIANADAPSLKRLGHTAAGAASNFAAPEVVAAARSLESMGTAGDLGGAGHAREALDRAVDRFRLAVAAESHPIVA